MSSLETKEHLPILEACIIGIIAGLAAVALTMGIDWLGAWRVRLTTQYPAYVVLPLFGCAGGLIAGLLVEKIAPEASGSGIPQVRARLDRIIMALDFRIAIVKLIGGTVALGAGFFLGREGPTVQLGAAMAAPLTRILPTTGDNKRRLIAAGAGAGLAAAFNAPLAGVTFILEELLKEISAATITIAALACSMAVLVLNIFLPPGTHHAHEGVTDLVKFHPLDVPFYILLGAVTGVCGVLFNTSIIGALNLNRRLLRIPVTFRVALAGLVSGAVLSTMPEIFHNYAGARQLIISGSIDWKLAVLAFVEFFLLTMVAYGSGAPGGLFAPTLVLGSAVGFLVGFLQQIATGDASLTTFAIVGMGAMFSAVARTPLTAIVITFEMASNFTLLTPLMITCVISSAVAELIMKGGLYDHLMRWNGIHLRSPDAPETLSIVKAADVMHKQVVSVKSKALVKDMLPMFWSSNQRGFPVEEKGRVIGIVTQSDLAKLGDTASLGNTTIEKIMTPHPVTVSSDDTLEEILFLFSRYKFNWLPVTRGDKLLGIILQSDVVKALFIEEMVERQFVEGEKIEENLAEIIESQPVRETVIRPGEISNTNKQVTLPAPIECAKVGTPIAGETFNAEPVPELIAESLSESNVGSESFEPPAEAKES